MNEHLISKKELLQRYGISYGALYRWKRKGLIPEEWFIKKSTVTGQETFFDEKTICERIECILSRSEETSLDDLASQIQPSAKSCELIIVTASSSKSFRLEDLRQIYAEDTQGHRTDITAAVLENFQNICSKRKEF